ncbi:hypothetical protein DB35_22270 [Streptomyces abyssalis]|uniref:Glycosyl hydrolase n=1 Tax=Streptomyces abyssalis TaxID=933944 RepID=A0A1E7JU29_9ACTN|nr:hypothetical protein DB35_22270 [Streptomyces abyssalis]OEU93424.1 hypothetical protein AN215_00885 [Streptomyces abyssalis]
MPGAASGAVTRPGGGVIRFERSSLSVRVAVGGAVFLGWDEAEPSPSYALPGPVPDVDTRAVLEPDKDGGWRLVSERLLLTVSRHGTVEVRTPGGELLRRDLPPRWWETGSAGDGKRDEPAGVQGAAEPEDARATVGEAAAAGRDEAAAPRGLEAGVPPVSRGGRWMHRSQVAADARFFGLGGRTCGPSLPDGSYPLHGRAAATAPDAARHGGRVPDLTMPVQLVVADAGTHLVFHDNPGEGRVTVRQGLEGRGSGHDRPGHSQVRMSGGPLRYWVMAGPPARVLHGWARLTGAPALPPGWALGHQHAGLGAGPGRRPGQVAAGYREHELPLRALHLDGPAGSAGHAGHAANLILRGERGRRAGLPPLAAELQAQGVHLVSGDDDAGKTASSAAGAQEPSATAHDSAGFALSQGGWAGVQRDGGTWCGEVATGWEGLRESLSLVVGLGLCGVPYSGPGIGGPAGTPSPELYLRWFQLAAYFPLFHVRLAKGTGPREPWAFGGETLSGCASAMAERERLRPYFTTLAHLAHRTGAPYVRPLWWQHPRERSLRDCGDAFLLGDALLVAPVLEEGARRRTVRLPHGRWYETVTGEVHEGPGEVLLDAPLSRIPVLARAGAAVPVTGTDGGTELEVWTPAPGRRGKGLVIREAGAGRGEQPAPAERFTVLRRGGTTVVMREDGAPVGYPVRLRS